jgi:hypothetical protein
MLKEKKFEMYPDPSMLSKFLPDLAAHPMAEYMGLRDQIYSQSEEANQTKEKTNIDIEEETKQTKIKIGKESAKYDDDLKEEDAKDVDQEVNIFLQSIKNRGMIASKLKKQKKKVKNPGFL